MLAILVPTFVLTAVVAGLAVLVLAARHWLVGSREVTLMVNGERSFAVTTGRNLLWALADHGLHLPSACGGRGSCGQCKLRITRNAPALLLTERAHITRSEAASGMHLACMVRIREDLDIQVAESVLEARRLECRVMSARNVTTFLREIVFALPDPQGLRFTAGAYVLLEAPPYELKFSQLDIAPAFRAEWERRRLFELVSGSKTRVVRAYSLASPPQQSGSITLLVRIALPPAGAQPGTPPGIVSSYAYSLRPGDTVWISGPFGEFHVQEQSGREMILIGGGAGIAPLRSMILDQLARGSTRRMSFWYGARNRLELCYADEFDALAARHPNFTWHVALSAAGNDAPWGGYTGFIHKVLYEAYLKDHPAPEDAEYYLCGPPLMSAAVVRVLDEVGVDAANVFYDDFGA